MLVNARHMDLHGQLGPQAAVNPQLYTKLEPKHLKPKWLQENDTVPHSTSTIDRKIRVSLGTVSLLLAYQSHEKAGSIWQPLHLFLKEKKRCNQCPSGRVCVPFLSGCGTVQPGTGMNLGEFFIQGASISFHIFLCLPDFMHFQCQLAGKSAESPFNVWDMRFTSPQYNSLISEASTAPRSVEPLPYFTIARHV